MDNPPQSAGICARCQTPATKRCSGCRGAPEYDMVAPEPTFYCSSACQTQHWGEHRVRCKRLQARKSLLRAVSLLQAILYRIRLHAYIFQFATAHMDGSKVTLNDIQNDKSKAYQPLKAVWMNIKSGDYQRVFYAIIMMNACAEAVKEPPRPCSITQSSAGCIDLCSRIEELTVSVHNTRLSIERSDGFPLIETGSHIIYRVVLKSGEIWAMDPSGAQYGFSECLYTWSDFEKYRLGKVHFENSLGYHRGKMSRFNGYGLDVLDMELLDLTLALEEKIPALANVYGGKLKLILQGSDATFQKAKNELLGQLSICVNRCLDEIYAPERVAKRSRMARKTDA
ncbi:hypothetical protein AARAC_008520 [Aspergillus arachidicola]|uniref:MYND-type domain-containing protein n=1 Tax=Aspergillus arachidicola TaxID=656916 RepID=A0A2G7FHA2_9EURO|nr:hypothetical protein AARAC_008520 [Aspergillus arachidicola]